jgi:2-keto-4-pentenoate hydratase
MREANFDPAPAAQALAELWRSGAQCRELPPEMQPTTLAQGYDIQDQLVAALDDRVVGWKLGVGSTAQKRGSGIGRSIAGRILASRLFGPGDIVTMPDSAPVTVEFEIGYVLGQDVLPDEPKFDLLDAVSEVRVAFELVRSRFVDRRAVGWPSFAADNSAFHALVLGPTLDPDDVHELISTLSVERDGVEVAQALMGDDMTDPRTALADLCETACERGMILPKGSIVSTGTQSRPFDVGGATGASICARFLGSELSFRIAVANAR